MKYVGRGMGLWFGVWLAHKLLFWFLVWAINTKYSMDQWDAGHIWITILFPYMVIGLILVAGLVKLTRFIQWGLSPVGEGKEEEGKVERFSR